MNTALDYRGRPRTTTASGEFAFAAQNGSVQSLELYLSNGAREEIPIVDNVFALQAPSAYPSKLVAFDDEHRVVAIRIVSVA